MKTKSVTAITSTGESIRITLPPAAWTGSDSCGTGITREAVYVGPRSKRVVVETYSIWDDGKGGHQGTAYMLIEDDETLAFLAGEYQEVADALESAKILVPETL